MMQSLIYIVGLVVLMLHGTGAGAATTITEAATTTTTASVTTTTDSVTTTTTAASTDTTATDTAATTSIAADTTETSTADSAPANCTFQSSSTKKYKVKGTLKFNVTHPGCSGLTNTCESFRAVINTTVCNKVSTCEEVVCTSILTGSIAIEHEYLSDSESILTEGVQLYTLLNTAAAAGAFNAISIPGVTTPLSSSLVDATVTVTNEDGTTLECTTANPGACAVDTGLSTLQIAAIGVVAGLAVIFVPVVAYCLLRDSNSYYGYPSYASHIHPEYSRTKPSQGRHIPRYSHNVLMHGGPHYNNALHTVY